MEVEGEIYHNVVIDPESLKESIITIGLSIIIIVAVSSTIKALIQK